MTRIQGFYYGHSGEVKRRHWRFQTNCQGNRCQTIWTRTSPEGIQRARLIPHRGYYTATFRFSVACERLPGTPGKLAAHFRLRWRGKGLIARERLIEVGRICDPTDFSRTRWVASPSP